MWKLDTKKGDQGRDHRLGHLLTPTEVAATLNVPRRRVITRELRRALPWIKLGTRTLRLPASALDTYLRSGSPDQED